MGRYNFPAFKTASSQRYVVIWDLQWHLIECERLEPAANLSAAMEATMGRLEVDGWEAEATRNMGLRSSAAALIRRLLMMTPRDPHRAALQTFSLFARTCEHSLINRGQAVVAGNSRRMKMEESERRS